MESVVEQFSIILKMLGHKALLEEKYLLQKIQAEGISTVITELLKEVAGKCRDAHLLIEDESITI